MYELLSDIKSFAVANDFVQQTNKACYELGKRLMPFCIFANDVQKAEGVLDFATFQSFSNPNTDLVTEIAEYRSSLYTDCGIRFNMCDSLQRKLLFYDYLMSVSVCYVEIPKFVTKNGVSSEAYDKFLCTRNPAIMGTWMGLSQGEMQAKYSGKLQPNQLEFSNNEIRLVKLAYSGKGNTISVPRKQFSVEKMVCIPLYMLYAFIEGFKPALSEGILQFRYLKDNGTVRELNSTLSESILREYYSDDLFIQSTLGGVDINTMKQGGMMLSSKISRGYIKIPELGSSVYDATGVRSLNFSRLLTIKPVSEVDRTFINVDLDSVLPSFVSGVDSLTQTGKVTDCYKALTGEEPETDNAVVIAESLKSFAEMRVSVLSTSFKRSLHLFIISHPEWFPYYTGKPVNQVVSSADMGIGTLDF